VSLHEHLGMDTELLATVFDLFIYFCHSFALILTSLASLTLHTVFFLPVDAPRTILTRFLNVTEDGKPEEVVIPKNPEIVVFASFTNVAKFPPRISALGEMANTSERLRQNNISHQYPHPVWLRQTRDCPLERPPPEEVVPPWKLIRPRNPKEAPSDEPRPPPEPPRPIQAIEITSPFINYKVSPVPIAAEV